MLFRSVPPAERFPPGVLPPPGDQLPLGEQLPSSEQLPLRDQPPPGDTPARGGPDDDGERWAATIERAARAALAMFTPGRPVRLLGVRAEFADVPE